MNGCLLSASILSPPLWILSASLEFTVKQRVTAPRSMAWKRLQKIKLRKLRLKLKSPSVNYFLSVPVGAAEALAGGGLFKQLHLLWTILGHY